jgi:hypothetical protein
MGIMKKNVLISLQRLMREERGSLSVLILGLFMTTLITLIILTDISAVYFAKRALTQATEAAAQRGVRNLDMEAYYRGKYNATQLLINLTGARESDPGIPIDCSKGSEDVKAAVSDFSRDRENLLSRQIGVIRIDKISCDGYQLSIETSSSARLPFVLPFIGVDEVQIRSQVGTFDERKVTTNYYGISIG